MLQQQCSCSSAPAAVLPQQCSRSSAPAAVLPQQCSCSSAPAAVLPQQCSCSSAPAAVLPQQCSCSSAPAAVLPQQCSSSSAPAAVLLQQQKCLTICSPISSDTLWGNLDSAVYQFNNLVLSSESISTAEILDSKPKQRLLSQKIEEADFFSFLHESSTASQANLKAVSQLPGRSLEEQP